MRVLTLLILFSAIAFIYYGVNLLIAPAMKAEFERYHLAHLRKLTGYLQLLGGIGLLTGLKYPYILSVSAAGLSLMMLCGFGVRVKIKDGFLLSAPSFLFMLLNLYIFVQSLK